MTYEQLKHLKPNAYKRRCGVHLDTFEQMAKLLRPHLERRGKRGGQCKLSVEDQLLVVLEEGARVSNAISYCYNLGNE